MSSKYRTKWKRIPKYLIWLFYIPAAFAWGFGPAACRWTKGSECRWLGCVYDLDYFSIMELPSGNWYLRISPYKNRN